MMSSKSLTACPGRMCWLTGRSGLCTAFPSRLANDRRVTQTAPTLPTVHLYYTPGLTASKPSMTSPCSDILKAARNNHVKNFQVQTQAAKHR